MSKEEEDRARALTWCFSNSSAPLPRFTVSKTDNLEYENQCKPVLIVLKPCRDLKCRNDLQKDLSHFPSTAKSVLATPKLCLADVCVTQSFKSALLDTSQLLWVGHSCFLASLSSLLQSKSISFSLGTDKSTPAVLHTRETKLSCLVWPQQTRLG